MKHKYAPVGRLPTRSDFSRLAAMHPAVATILHMHRRGDMDWETCLIACCLVLADMAEAHLAYATEVSLKSNIVYLMSPDRKDGGACEETPGTGT